MQPYTSRAQFFAENPGACAWAALDEATNNQKKVTPGAIKMPKDHLYGKKVLILGAGVAGLTTAYELLAQETGAEITVLEAQNRTGGRCLSLRTGDTLTEDQNSDLFDAPPSETTQVVRFKQPVGDSKPYLNAGPGRIPSSHKRLLGYLKQFGVAVEVYVMNSESNLVQMQNGPFGSEPAAYRRLDHNTRGWIAQMVYEKAEDLLTSEDINIPADELNCRVEQLRNLMVSFGELTKTGKYNPTAGEDGKENARSRGGFKVLPGVDAGVIARAIDLNTLLESRFWKKTRFYQPVDFLWQPTLFQPVGGMDQVQHAFAKQVAELGGTVHLNSPVQCIDWDPCTCEFVVHVSQVGTDEVLEYRADYCFSNMAMPFLQRFLSDRLQNTESNTGLLNPEFRGALQAVYQAQFNPTEVPDENGYVAKFLANTTKVGWQADRDLWQGGRMQVVHEPQTGCDISVVPQSQVGVVPIFGGISWTDHDIAQIWYPSSAYHDQLGVLTGAYNFSEVAYAWGKMPIDKRLCKAREGAARFNTDFADGLGEGVAIAWQNMPYIKGGWAQWHVVDQAVEHFNTIAQGSSIDGASDPVFFVIGDQISSLPGWQEGAIASALNALCRVARPDLEIPCLSSLPDTRMMVEGV